MGRGCGLRGRNHRQSVVSKSGTAEAQILGHFLGCIEETLNLCCSQHKQRCGAAFSIEATAPKLHFGLLGRLSSYLTAVFNPAKEKSQFFFRNIGTGRAYLVSSPSLASSSTTRPPPPPTYEARGNSLRGRSSRPMHKGTMRFKGDGGVGRGMGHYGSER
eukprot:9495527-Pyramimonas_sp.AAC.2